MKRASCGLDVNFSSDVCSILRLASTQGYEFVCLPLVHPRFKREFTEIWKDRKGPFTRPDLILKSNDWNSLIAGKISSYINVDSEILYYQSKCALEQELSYANHLDVPAIIISLKSSNCFNLARIINSNLTSSKPQQVWLEIPLISKNEQASVWRNDAETDFECTWEWWNTFRTLCNSDKRLGIVLEVTKKLPESKELLRWIGEPIKCLAISTSTFLTNKKGYPVLSKAHQSFVRSLAPLDIQVVIKGNNHHHSFDCYQRYIDHLWQQATKQNSEAEETSPSEYVIQWPLQPVADNLVSETYESFETDSVKYNQYLKAIYYALVDIKTGGEKSSNVTNIMIVGAGRGPLVMAALQAAAKAETEVKIYAVEKNPHAAVTLQAYQEELWHSSVKIISEDIRILSFPQEIDIMVSEILGSFGDNELSPEILDEAQKFLRKGGISIPQSYTSYVCPVQSSKVYSELKINKEKSDFEMPYVITQKNRYHISQSKELFTFHHPNYNIPINNFRYKKVIFNVEQNCVLHGFSGFFETILYKDIKLSILPERHTPGLFSWHSLFFPLMEHVNLKTGDEIELHFWRIVGRNNVWYEWTVTKPIPLPIHNVNGRFSKIDLQ